MLAAAAMVTEVSDRESDLYAKWARVPGGELPCSDPGHARPADQEGGGKLSTASLQPAGQADVDLRERPGRAARTAHLVARFGQVTLMRPRNTLEKNLPKTLQVSLVEVIELGVLRTAPSPILWRLLTTQLLWGGTDAEGVRVGNGDGAKLTETKRRAGPLPPRPLRVVGWRCKPGPPLARTAWICPNCAMLRHPHGNARPRVA